MSARYVAVDIGRSWFLVRYESDGEACQPDGAGLRSRCDYAIVVARDANGKVVSTSKVIHVATKGGKVGNSSKVKTAAKSNKVTLKKGKTFSLEAKAVAASKKLTVKSHRAIKYESSDPAIATVSTKGVVKAKKAGTCYVYAYAQNGIAVKVKVTVK